MRKLSLKICMVHVLSTVCCVNRVGQLVGFEIGSGLDTWSNCKCWCKYHLQVENAGPQTNIGIDLVKVTFVLLLAQPKLIYNYSCRYQPRGTLYSASWHRNFVSPRTVPADTADSSTSLLASFFYCSSSLPPC